MGRKPEGTHFRVESKKSKTQKNQVCGKMKWEIGEVRFVLHFFSFDGLVYSHL